MIKAIIFDLWETLGSKNIGISKSLQEKFGIEKTSDFMHLYESSIQLQDWKSEKDMAENFLKEFNVVQSEENVRWVIDLFRQGIEKATMFPGMKELLLSLKQNYQLGFISNTTVFESTVLDHWDIRNLFTVTSFSWQLGIKKPTSEIFQVTLARLGVQPGEAVFIDDGKKNIEKAKELGLRGIVFESVPQLKAELEKLDVLI
jgi:HAD superfamily hydrolase (TIGR01509 family)